jgi:hypothetical protein
MGYRPGDTFNLGFTTQSTTGAATDADSLPTASVRHNGTVDGTVTVTVTHNGTGDYSASGTIPSGYAAADSIGVLALATVGGNAAKYYIYTGPLDHLATDPWAISLPGSYTTGSAGQILGHNLDAAVSTRLATSGYTAPPSVAGLATSTALATLSTLVTANLDVAVSTRSTFAGGAVASVTAPVTVGTNSDKTGYSLAASGLDSITIEAGVNARQALSAILAACGGIVIGAGTGTIVIKGGNVFTTRITATTDLSGNRSSVTLTLPT